MTAVELARHINAPCERCKGKGQRCRRCRGTGRQLPPERVQHELCDWARVLLSQDVQAAEKLAADIKRRIATVTKASTD